MYSILLVDDDVTLLSTSKDFFQNLGYEVFCASCGTQALQMVSSIRLDCIILDIKLPDSNGFDLCKRIRKFTEVPLIFLSSFTEEEAKLKGFSLGADDYVCKPFSLKELEVRIRLRVQRRFEAPKDQILHYGTLTIHLGNRTVYYGDQKGEFTSIEFDILSFLARHPNQLFSYEQMYDGIWKEPLGESLHNLQARVASVRQKLLDLCPNKEYIKTVRRKGYFFEP